jgi:hypothetical protein
MSRIADHVARGAWPGGGGDVLRLSYGDCWAGVATVSPVYGCRGALWYSGIHMLSNLVCDDLQAVHIGIPVRVGFEVVNEWLTLPSFFPRRGSPSREEDSLSASLEGV